MWEITLSGQIQTFIFSITLGLIISFNYYFTTALSIVTNLKRITFLFDVIFFTLSAIITFIFLLSRTNGEIRGYVLLGEMTGFVISKKIFGKFLVKIFSKIFALIFHNILIFDNYFFKIGQKSYKKIKKTLKTCDFYLKKLLKSIGKILYNILVEKYKKE